MAEGSARDFFISYTGVNEPWARWIAVTLERAGYSTLLQAFDFRPGEDFLHLMQQATSGTARTIAVLSPAYFGSRFGEAEWRAAFAEDPGGESGRLIPVRVQPCEPPGLLAGRIFIDLVDADEQTARQRLLDGVGPRAARPSTAAFPGGPHRTVGTGSPRFPGAGPEMSNLPARNPRFTGRDGMLAELRRRLHAGEGTLVVQALYGLGGVGKTQLALEYAHRYAADYDLVWWIDAEQPVLLGDQLAALAARLDLPPGPTVAATVDRLLAELRGRDRWLLIFDNAERPADVAGYRPDGPGHLLITSRNPGWGALGGRIEVAVLARAETVALLRARIPAMSEELADQLAAELGDLPLAAAQAAGYLEQTELPAADYLRRFHAHRTNLLARGDVVGYRGRVDTAWALSLQRLRDQDPAAVQLLELAAFLAPEPVPLVLFADHAELLDEPLRCVAADPDALADTVGALVGYSLARRHGDGFQVHRLVQAVIRQQLPPDRQQATAERVVALLAAAAPGDPESPAHWAAYATLAPHVLATAPLADHSPAARRLVLDTVRYLQAHGDSSGSRAVGEPLLDHWRASLGPDHPDTLAAASIFAFARIGVGEAEPARALAQDTLERCRRVLGPDHTTTLWTAATGTVALFSLGEAEPARELGEDTLQRCRRVFGPDHSTTLMTATAVTIALISVGEAEPARELGEDTLQRCRRVFGPDHSTTLLAAAGLAFTLGQLGQAEPARALGEDTLQRSRRVFGPDHGNTLFAAAGLASALDQLGQAEPARALGEDTLQRSRRVFGSDHPITLLAAAGVTRALAQLGQAGSARDLGQDTLQRCRRVLGSDHAITLWTAAELITVLVQLGQARSARDLGQDTLQRCRRVFGSDHPTTLLAAAGVTWALVRLGEAEPARTLSEDTLQRCARVLGPDHPITLLVATALTGALQIDTAAYGSDHPEVATDLEALAEVQERQGDTAAAAASRREAQRIRKLQ